MDVGEGSESRAQEALCVPLLLEGISSYLVKKPRLSCGRERTHLEENQAAQICE